MTETMKTAIITIILIATALSGCLDGADTAKEDVTIERMVQLEAILTDPEISEEEKIATYTLAHEAITGEKIELDTEVNVTPTEVAPKYHFGCAVDNQGCDPINGIGYLNIEVMGILEPDNTTVSGFTKPNIDLIKHIEVFINNESIDKFVPIAHERRKITTTIVGDWYVQIYATLKDGTIVTQNPIEGFGMVDLSDHPSYKKSEITVTGSGPFDARYIETDDRTMTRAEAKALCDELGIVWGDERDI